MPLKSIFINKHRLLMEHGSVKKSKYEIPVKALFFDSDRLIVVSKKTLVFPQSFVSRNSFSGDIFQAGKSSAFGLIWFPDETQQQPFNYNITNSIYSEELNMASTKKLLKGKNTNTFTHLRANL